MLHPLLRRSLVALVLACSFGIPAEALRAQTPTEAELSGTVRTALGEPIQRPVITVLDADGETIRSFTGLLDGTFALRGVGLGVYSVRIEALGFRPQVIPGVALRPGVATQLQIVLAGGAPGVDTVAAPAGASVGAASARWLDAVEFRAAPAESPTLDGWTRLSTFTDEGLGLAGLPGANTALFIDGLPFRPVRPLGLRSLDRGLGLVTARTVAAAQVGVAGAGRALPSGAGGRIGIHSVRGTGAGVTVDAAGSTGPLRQSTADPDDPPSTRSIQAGGMATLTPAPDTTAIVVAADVWQVERPRAGLLAAAEGGVEGIRAPYVERRRGLSAFARLDHSLGAAGSLWGTARFAVQPAAVDLTGSAWGLVDTGERTDLLVGGGFLAVVGRRELLEIRLGVGRSAWTSAAAAGVDLPFQAGSPTFLDASTGLQGGPGPLEAESASRLDGDLIAALQARRGTHSLYFGLRGGWASHSQDLGRDPWIRTAVGTGVVDGTWSGAFVARRYRGEVDATVPRFGIFAEDTWAAGSDLQLRYGAGFDSEWVPVLDILPNSNWFTASGLTAPTLQEQVSAGSGFVDLTWSNGGTQLTLGAAYESHAFDPTLLIEVLNSRDYDVYAGMGSYGAWPGAPAGAVSPNQVAPGYAYLVDDPSAPATMRLSAGVHRAAGPVEFGVGGVFRFTEGLTRRRNLNRTVVAHGADQNGRALWAQPWKVGSWLGADPATLGRFGSFGPVWELDQGGWSEYLGVTGRLAYTVPGGIHLSGEYTWSRTEDNVPGLGSQGLLVGVPLEAGADDDPTEGVSDLDRPHRLTGTLAVPLPVGEGSRLSAVYRFWSGTPFTPGYAPGVDANLDGVMGNAPAFVSDAAAAAHPGWDCLDDDRGAFATRNGCRRADLQTLDLRLEIGLPGPGIGLFVDAFNVLDQEVEWIDTALLGVRAGSTLTSVGASTALPFETNAGFGSGLADRSSGRMIRLGVRVGR